MERAPGFVKAKIGGAYVTSIVAFLAILYMIWNLYAQITTPGFTTVTPQTATGAIIIGAAGFILYHGVRWYRLRKEGLDIALIFKEVPPV
jgi:amino acid transporter